MTMNIALELTPEMETRLREGIARQDAETVRRVLHDAVEPTVRTLIIGRQKRLTVEEFEHLADELAAAVASQLPQTGKVYLTMP